MFNYSRKISPDRCGSNPKAEQEFQEIKRTYSVVMNGDLIEKCDTIGRDRLCEEDDIDKNEDNLHPKMLYTLLFGSEKLVDHIGRLEAVTSTRF